MNVETGHVVADQTPDLSGLDEALRRRVDVAVARGAAWWPPTDTTPSYALRYNGRTLAEVAPGTPHVWLHPSLPDPENNHADAWELAVSEHLWAEPAKDNGECVGWFGMRSDRPWGRERATALVNTPERAVVDAFLAKSAAGG